MTSTRSAIAAVAAVALFISFGARGATRAEALAAMKTREVRRRRPARRESRGAAEGRRPAHAAVRRHPPCDAQVTCAACQQGYVSISAYGDDLPSAARTARPPRGSSMPSCIPRRCRARRRSRRWVTWPPPAGSSFCGPRWPWRAPAAVPCHRATARCAPISRAAKAVSTGREFASACCPTATTARRARSSPVRRSRAPREDIANGDLPRDVLVLKDLAAAPSGDCSDEGRAMMQLIHDVAPGVAAGVLHGVRKPGRFRRGHSRAGGGGLAGHRRRRHLLRRADVRRRHHRAGGR